jgi:hypothetical protein
MLLCLHEKVSVNRPSKQRQQSVNSASTEHQHSINDYLCCILYNPGALLLCLPLITVSAAFRGNIVSVNVTTPENEHQQSINRQSAILGLGSCLIPVLYNSSYPESTEWQPLWAMEITRWSHPQSENDCQHSFNSFGCCSWYNPRGVRWHVPITKFGAASIGNIVSGETATTQTVCQQHVTRAWTDQQLSVYRVSTEC